MGKFVKVGTKAEFEDIEAGKLAQAGGQSIAIFNLGGTYYAIENTCPHRGGPLAEGMLAGEEVICPWHGSRFNGFELPSQGHFAVTHTARIA